MKIFLNVLLFIPIILFKETVYAQKETPIAISWSKLAQLPNENGKTSPGYAGAINGFINGVLIVAGGANFPDKMPWEQGKKHYAKTVQVLQTHNGDWWWNAKLNSELPEAIAYCGNTVTEKGIVYAGGENESGLSKKTYILTFSKRKNSVEIKRLPDLPVAVTNLTLTSLKNIVYLVGGDEQSSSSNQFLSLDLNADNPAWMPLKSLPDALANAAVVAVGNQVYVIGGRTKTVSGISDLRHITYVYNTVEDTWKELAPISNGKNITNLSASAAVAIKKNNIIVLGGDDGVIFHQIEVLISQIAKATNEAEKNRLILAKNQLVIHHKGFSNGILLYNIKTNSWKKIGELPFLAPVTTTATKYKNQIILSNGEIKPGIRTPNIMLGEMDY